MPQLLLIFSVSLYCALAASSADEASGCPSYGCLPSGTFALSADIPGTGNRAVGTTWTVPLVSARQSGRPSRLGCVTCQEGVVCSTNSGYAAVDQLKGGVVWRYDNMTSPSLPILNIYGDVIGTDGKHLVKILAGGQVQKPIIKIYGHLEPMYSLEIANDNLFLMTSYVNGELITYATDGIPEASLTLRAVVERANGTFLPVAQPVIYGKRAYILMQFVPDSHRQVGAGSLGLQRLYAVDLWARMTDRISPVWYFNFERMACQPPRGQPHVSTGKTPSVLVHNNTVYVSLGRPEVSCSGRHGDVLSTEEDGMLWAIRDNGTEAEVLFKVAAPVSSLSLYDVSVGQQSHVPSWNTGRAGFPHRGPAHAIPLKYPTGTWEKTIPASSSFSSSSSSSSAASGPVLWAATSQQITGYNSRNGSVEHVIDVSKLLNVSCRLTSKMMVAKSKDGKSERLVFAVSESASKNNARGRHAGNSTKPYVVAVSLDSDSGQPKLLWRVAAKPGTEVVGQIANILFVPPTKRADSRRNNSAKGNGGGDSTDVHGREDDHDNDDVEVLLVATAVSDTDQFSFAIGHQ